MHISQVSHLDCVAWILGAKDENLHSLPSTATNLNTAPALLGGLSHNERVVVGGRVWRFHAREEIMSDLDARFHALITDIQRLRSDVFRAQPHPSSVWHLSIMSQSANDMNMIRLDLIDLEGEQNE